MKIRQWLDQSKIWSSRALSRTRSWPGQIQQWLLKIARWIKNVIIIPGSKKNKQWTGKIKPWVASLKIRQWPGKIKQWLLKIARWIKNVIIIPGSKKIKQWAGKIKSWVASLKIRQWPEKIKQWPVTSKIIQWVDVSDDDGFLLRALVVLAFLMLLILFAFGPCYDYGTVPEPVPEPRSVISRPARSEPALPKPKPKPLYLRAAPSPTITQTPVPTPTPTGGGFHKIAFASNRANGRYYQLHMMDSDGNNVERLTECDAFDRDPHFSYDGGTIAFTSNRAGGIYQIYLLDIKTRAIRQITSGPKDKTNPIWSPDNNRILFTIHRGGSSELGMMDATGANLTLLTNTYGNNHGYSFSPDGKIVAYESSVNNRSEVFIMELETRKSSLLIKTGELGYRGDPVYSPAGGRLIFTTDLSENRVRQISVYDMDLDHHKRVTKDPVDKDDPAVSPDGTEVAFIARWENAWNIFIMNIDGTNRRNITKSYYDNLVPTWR